MITRTLAAVLVGAALTLAAALVTAPARAQDGAPVETWQGDNIHSGAIFRIRHAGVTNFYGAFWEVGGTFSIDPANPSNSSFNFTVVLESVDTGSESRDNHLKSADFFNVRQFPEATFVSTAVAKDGASAYRVTGDLTLHGVTKSITATLEHTGDGTFRNNPVRSFEATFEIKRTDFGMTAYVAPDGGDSGPLGNTVRVIVSVEGNPAQ